MVQLVDAKPEVVADLQRKLADPATPLPEKYRVLFSIRNVAGAAAHAALLVGLKDDSALFRHDVAFCLGQRQEPSSVEPLKLLLRDTAEHPMVRHEAAEALGAIGTPECLEPLRAYEHDQCREVAETCQLALQRVARLVAEPGPAETDGETPRYYSVDPAPPLPASTPATTLRALLVDEATPMFQRYSAMFTLRNKGGPEAVEALAAVMATSTSALLKHEVAYVLGQMLDARAVEVLTRVLQDPSEAAMVRHEAAEALGAIADPAAEALLRTHVHDAEPVVAHSCVVALDVMEHERSGNFQYAAAA